MKDFIRLMEGVSISETIRSRRSVRTYSGRPLQTEMKERIEQVLGQLTSPFQGKSRLQLIDKKDAAVSEGVKLGTYGVILGAPSFIAAATEKSSQAMEHLGYVLEQLVLFVTSRGLGTCWLAGTFRKSAFAAAMHLGKDEIVPVVSPVGYPSRIRGPVDMLFKPIPALKRRAAWHSLFFDGAFDRPLDKTDAGPYTLPLEMLRLAPSASNKQPWRILKDRGRFLFFLDHDLAYRKRYEFDVQKIDMGIAMLHFESTAREAGLAGHWEMSSASRSGFPETFEHVATWVSDGS
jgi:nitroreductase